MRPATDAQALTELLLLAMTAPEPLVAELMQMTRRLASVLDTQTVALCYAAAEERADLFWSEYADALVVAAS